jgi:hypothetical protein
LTLAALTFLSPAAAFVAVVVLVPLGALVVAASRVARVRAALGLPHPERMLDRRTAVAASAVVLLLALAAAQPALTRGPKQRVRTDAEVLFVLDTSQSMAASHGPRGATRLERAKRQAASLRAELRDVPSGVATLTDRVLPNLLPVTDAAAFDATLQRAVAIEDPPPFETTVRATDFAALAGVPEAGFFDPSARHRVVVLLTDGETRPYDSASVSKSFGASPRAGLVAVRLWRADEAIYRTPTRSDPSYRPDPTSAQLLAGLAAVTGGSVFQEGEVGAAVSAVRDALGTGPTKVVGRVQSVEPLGPYVAFAALLPLAFLFSPRGARARRRAPARPASAQS